MRRAREYWFRHAQNNNSQELTNAKLREQDRLIQPLQAQIQNPPPQPQRPSATGKSEEALVAVSRELQTRFDNQAQELVGGLQEKYNQQAVDLANLTARLDHHMSQESSSSDRRDQELGGAQSQSQQSAEARWPSSLRVLGTTAVQGIAWWSRRSRYSKRYSN